MSICTDCGLCCNGVLFVMVEVTADEERRLARKLPIHQHRVAQPCSALSSDGRCSIYSERPSRCVDYQCRVLEGVERGEISEADARARIARTKELAAAIRRRIPGNGPLWRDVHARDWSRVAEDGHADLLLDLIVFKKLTDAFVATAGHIVGTDPHS